ncbi:hypothetical protein ONS95_001117 [Cadophora gregata]|uniref:uncharacterized protein n=1 Tax=Cadophora gregata TaxID=51156 RepID=UPI0026DB41CB|nr:uncharacterized protein ONS95_001117 [Cadophora gregata]KAK0129182.1 hypothetical protein ONS95_001117 [Cadophora gregata]
MGKLGQANVSRLVATSHDVNSNFGRDEHFKRSPECPFFALINEHLKSPAPKKAKAKRDRTSKASRFSTQSAFTVASEVPEDLPAEEEDSILTTATTATTKKMGRAKKAPAAKGKKTRAKKGEPVEVVEAPEPEDDDFEVKVDVDSAPKPSRARKRKSEDEVEVAPTVDIAPPPAKRRATRTRGSTAIDDSILNYDDQPQEKPKPAVRKGRPSRKVSTASVAPTKAPFLDDDEIDKALEADLNRPLTEDEGEPVAILPPKRGRASKIIKTDHHMFDASPIDIDEAAIDAELEAMEVETKPLPKAKGAKAKQPRKVSAKQRSAGQKAADAAAEAERQAEDEATQQITDELEHSISVQHSSPVIQQKKQRAPVRQPSKKAPGRATRGSVMSVSEHSTSMVDDIPNEQIAESGNDTDDSIASQSTVVRGGSKRRGSTMKKGKGGKKGPGRNIEEIVHKVQEQDLEVEEEAPVPSEKGKRTLHIEEITMTEETYYSTAPEMSVAEPEIEKEEPAPQPAKPKTTKARGRPRKVSTPAPAPAETVPEEEEIIGQEVSVPPEPTPVKAHSPLRSSTPPPRELTPSQSPQSSDAENHPPSSKPSALAQRLATPTSSRPRVPLSESTPIMSPSKRNIIAGLQSNQPWTSVDLETIFPKSPRATGSAGDVFGNAVDKVKNGELTSPEKRMTVEEWIKHNAAMAEEKLKSECERMVSVFESEGSRAMQALEGVECLE